MSDPTPDTEVERLQRALAAAQAELAELDALRRKLADIAAVCADTRRRGEDYIGGMARIEAIARGE